MVPILIQVADKNRHNSDGQEMASRDLFEDVRHSEVEHQAASSPPDFSRIASAALNLAILFSDDDSLPLRFRRHRSSSSRIRQAKKDSELEKRFKAHVKSWHCAINTMLAKLDRRQAWRFIQLTPLVDSETRSVTDNKDFCDFIAYLILRRDKEECCPDELGALALLPVAFQREVEKHIRP